MKPRDKKPKKQGADYDVSIIRPQMRMDDIQMRGQEMPAARLKAVKKGLTTLHTLETMAVNIYKLQITKKTSEHNRQLIGAMCNEMTHLQDFQVKLFEYGWRPSILRWMYWTLGLVIGFVSRLMGTRAVLKAGIWVEEKAVHHYGELLQTVEWDEDTRKVVEKNRSDEQGHVDRWRELLHGGEG